MRWSLGLVGVTLLMVMSMAGMTWDARAMQGATPSATGAASPVPSQTAAPVVEPIVLSTPAEDGSIRHTVQEGQTLWAIASRYKVPLDDILALNHMTRTTVVYVGDVLLIRLGEGQSPPPAPTQPSVYVVQAGETLWEIAVTHGLTLDELLDINGLTRASVIKAGDTLLLVPTPETIIPPTATATVPTLTPTPVIVLEGTAILTPIAKDAPADDGPNVLATVATIGLGALIGLAGVGWVVLMIARRRNSY